MESSVVSLELAQALLELPKITAQELYTRLEGKIGTVSLPQFRIELSKWLADGTIPGYEARLGRVGGIYRKGSPNITLNAGEKPTVQLDPAPISAFIGEYLKTNTRITVSQLIELVDIAPLNEGQFRSQMSEWLNDGKTFPLFESRKGKTGGIYPKGAEVDKWIPSVDESNEGTEAEHSNGFAVQITNNLRVHQSDERNWVIQKLTGQTWVNKGYHPNIAGCLKSVVKHMVNGEFSGANNLVQLKDLANVFKEVESRIFTQLEKNLQVQV